MRVYGIPRPFRLGDAASALVDPGTTLVATAVPASEVALPDSDGPVVNIEKQNDLLTFLSLASSMLMIFRSL